MCTERRLRLAWASAQSDQFSLFTIQFFIFQSRRNIRINVKTIAFGNKGHTTDKKMGVSVLLRLFISSNEVCNTAYAL